MADAPKRPAAIIDWKCKVCKRRGIAILLHNDPKTPGERAFLAHESMLAGRTIDCQYPSITWTRRP